MFKKFKNEMRTTWQTINVIINNPCTKQTINSILDNNIECKEVNVVVEVFGKYFSEAAGNLEADIPQTSYDPLSLIPIKCESIFLIQYLPPNVKT